MASRSAASFEEMLTCLLMISSCYLIQQERLLKNRFWLKKRLNSVFAIFAADAGVLKSAPGCLGIVGHGIDHDATGSQLGGHAPCAIEVSPQDSGVETIFGVVGDADRFILGVVSDHAEHGAENLLLGNRHVVLYIDKHRWLHEEARFKTLRMAFSADQHLRTFFNAFANVGFDALVLFLRHYRSNHNVGIRGIADRVVTHLIPYGPLYLVEPALGHEEPRSGCASLTAVQKGQDKRRRDGLVERGVVEQDCGGLSTEFERDPLHRCGAVAHDLFSDSNRPRERYLRHIRIAHHLGADDGAETCHHIEDTVW